MLTIWPPASTLARNWLIVDEARRRLYGSLTMAGDVARTAVRRFASARQIGRRPSRRNGSDAAFDSEKEPAGGWSARRRGSGASDRPCGRLPGGGPVARGRNALPAHSQGAA